MSEPRVLACLPKDRDRLAREIPDAAHLIPRPTDLYVEETCENKKCGQAILVGPRQREARELDSRMAQVLGLPPLATLCYVCAIKATADMRVPVVELGGGAGVEGNVL